MKIGDRAVVVGVELDPTIARRLRALGFTAGTEVTVLRKAPLGDPIEYELRGGRVSIRGTDARHILVDPVE